MNGDRFTGRGRVGSSGCLGIGRIAFAVAWALLCASAAPASAQAPLTSLHAIHTLTKAEAQSGHPVAFEATVTYYNRSDVDLFVQDGGEAIYVETKPDEDLVPGDRVLVRGKTRDSFTTDVLGEDVTVLHHGELPTPVAANFGQMIRAERDCMWATVRATVRSADRVNFGQMHGIFLKLLMDGGAIDATVVGSDAIGLDQFLDADVEVTGVVSGRFDSKMQLIGILLEVPSITNVKIVKRAEVSPDSLPIAPMNQVLSAYSLHDLTHRVRVKGTITYYQPGSAVVLQNGATSLWISTHSSTPMRVGDVAESTGFPDTHDGFLTLTDGEIRDTSVFDPVLAQPATWRQLATWNSGDPDGHQSDLISFEGKVMAAVREDSQDEFVLQSEGKLFTAIYRHPPSDRALPPMREIAVGTRIRVTGICMADQPGSISPEEQEVPFNILLRSFDDIAVVAKPSLLSVRNLLLLTGFLLLLLFLAGARSWSRERKVRRQNGAAAFIERQRSRILEDINGTRPLAEIIEEIADLASYKMSSAPCWCQIVDGAQLGKRPPDLSSFGVIQVEILGRSGTSLGTIYAAIHPHAKTHGGETETLNMAAALAALAIETRRLYSDLVRRSEFDLLTDTHNRFSLGSYLDQQIEQARQFAGIFGLLYIDLNDFKKVNDVYGHQIGDLYLQEVAVRMKRQLRGADMLARLGGDEFAILLPTVRNRAAVKDIAHRIGLCFESPFCFDGPIIHGSASIGIALYPEDGASRDSLLSAADAEMYVNKQVRRENISGQLRS
jgi:diguanylate cyclase (GGDEF)-like protein